MLEEQECGSRVSLVLSPQLLVTGAAQGDRSLEVTGEGEQTRAGWKDTSQIIGLSSLPCGQESSLGVSLL